MSTRENKALIHRWFEEVWNRGNLVAINELIASDLVLHEYERGKARVASVDREAVKRFVDAVHAVCANFHVAIEHIVAEGKTVVAIVTLSGTHTGEWAGLTPSGKQVEADGFAVFHIADDQISEIWTNLGRSALMREIGVITPAPWQVAWAQLTAREKREVFLQIAKEVLASLGATRGREDQET